VRKVHAHNGATVEERIYLGGFEIYRKRVGGDIVLERETLHIMDDKKRIALVDTRTQGHDDSPPQLTRYQFDNHLGSACLELNEFGAVISYEEYHPYGTTSYQVGPNAAEVSLKRYRYTGKERDEETGLYYHGARYYAPWLGRWCSADPAGLVDGSNLYSYVRLNPITRIDLKGFDSVTLGSDVSNEEIIGFFRQVDRNSYLQRVERFALATNYNIERVEGRTIRQVSTTKFSGHFRSLVSERNVQRVNTQLERISNLRAANTIPILFTFLAAFRESGPMAYDPREISDTYWGGGLDNLFNQQFDLRNRGVLPEDIDFKRGTDYGGSGDSGTHLSARVPADKKIIAYAARAGFASQRFIELATSRRYGYTMDDIHNLSRLQLNFWLALTFAAEGGEPTWNDYLERKESGERGGFGVQTLLAYLAERGLGLAEVTNLRGTFTQNGRSIQHHGHIRNNVRIRKAMILAANVTALEEEFEVWRNSERPLPSQENQCISVGYCP
jgi:RHS repeat-associated protein